MTNEEWDNFVDNNVVPFYVLENIIKKIIQHEELSEKEIAVYNENSNVIENVVRNIKNDHQIE